MKTRKRKIGIEIIRTAVVDARRNLIIGLVALLTESSPSLPVPNVKRRMMRFNPANM
jgi:hypothetical protein